MAVSLERVAILVDEVEAEFENPGGAGTLPTRVCYQLHSFHTLSMQFRLVLLRYSSAAASAAREWSPLDDLREHHHQGPDLVEPGGHASLVLGVLVHVGRGWWTRPVENVGLSEVQLVSVVAEEDKTFGP